MKLIADEGLRAWATWRADVSSRPAKARQSIVLTAVLTAGALLAGVAVNVPGPVLGALTGSVLLACVVVARHSLAAVTAGLGLRIARPYCPGERVRLRVRSTAGEVEAEIVHVGIANTTLATRDELVVVPNNRMLGRAPRR